MSSLTIATLAAALIVLASVLSVEFGIAVALIEIMLGVVAGNVFGLTTTPWMDFLAAFASIVLTFLAGAEVDPTLLREKFTASMLIGGLSFLLPFALTIPVAFFLLGWDWRASEIAGVALSTTSLAVVYAVLVETGLTETTLGKLIMAACFITDFGTALALSLLFITPTPAILLFVAVSVVVVVVVPRVAPRFFARYGDRVIEPEIKLIFVSLFVLMLVAEVGASHAVLPAFLFGLAMARTLARHRAQQRRLRRDNAMRIVYTSDLHGNQQHNARLLHFAIEQGARAVVLGGDLFPNSHEPRRGLLLQRQFVRDVFAPWLQRIRAEFRSLTVYALPGNEDWASTTDLLVDLAESELFYPLHHRVWRLNDQIWLAGSSLVPITPFVAKDWDRLEGIEPDPPFPIGGGMRSMYGLLRSVTLADVQALPTIREELALFPAQSNPAGTIYVFHSPPYATALDRLADGRAVGSRAARAFIEEHQPPLTLHGHIHESPMVSGSYAERIGRTLSVNPGQSPDRLHAVIFETDDPRTTLVHTVFGEFAMVKTNEYWHETCDNGESWIWEADDESVARSRT